jgi:hypothetical protein
MTDPDAPATWWPIERQRAWRALPVAAVDWVVVWNVNLGGGGAAFSVENGYWGNHPFERNAVPVPTAWTWLADDTPAPETWTNVRGFGGIPSLIWLTRSGVPLSSGTILVPRSDTLDDLVALAATLDTEVAAHGGAWCPVLVGAGDGPRLGVSHQRTTDPTAALRTAEALGIDDVVVVDEFHELGHADALTPRVFVEGRRDGTRRRARPGRVHLAQVPVPPEVDALRRIVGARSERSHRS